MTTTQSHAPYVGTEGSRNRLAVGLIFFLVATKICVLFAFSLNTRFVMDEFWQFHQSYYVFNGYFETIWPEKAILYAAVFKIPALLGSDAVSQLLAARVFSAGLAVLLVGVVCMTSRSLGHTRVQMLIVALILLSFSTFIERSFRLRSEPLAILLAVTAVLVVLRGSVDNARGLLVAGVLSGLAFVSTQKSIYFNVALGAGLVVDALASYNLRNAVKRSMLLIAGWIVALVSYAIFFGGADAPSVLNLTFFGPLEVATSAQNYYESLHTFLYQTLSRNAALYLICFIGLMLQLVRFFELSSPHRIHLIATLVIAALVFSHNQPWPYVFTMALPFLAPYAIPIGQKLATTPRRTTCLYILLIVVVANSFAKNAYYFQHDNRDQLAVVRAAEAMTPHAGSYFDGIGMLPNRGMHPYAWLDAMNVHKTFDAGENSDVVKGIDQNYPEVIVESYRTRFLTGLLKPITDQSYVAVDHNILVPGRRLQAGETQEFNVLKGRTFVAVDGVTGALVNEIVIDGKRVTLPYRLDAGRYSVASLQTAPVWLVTDSFPLDYLGPRTEQKTLFEDVYSF